MASDKKLVIVTGGNSGIGLEACKILCAEGHTVVATVRSEEKGQYCVSQVKAANPEGDIQIHFMICEMTKPASVKQLADDFKATWLTEGRCLDVLVNNAGISPPNESERYMCEENPEWEQTMAINCIAPILLTDLLMDSLKQTAQDKGTARVVMVNSSITLADGFVKYQTDVDDPMMAKPGVYKGAIQAYKNSKVALMMSTLAMVDELQDTTVRVTSMCPGMIPGTNIGRSNTGCCAKCCFGCLIKVCCCLTKPQSNEKGGRYIVDIAVHEKGNSSGLFFVRGDMKSPTPQVLDKQKQIDMLNVVRNYTKEQRS